MHHNHGLGKAGRAGRRVYVLSATAPVLFWRPYIQLAAKVDLSEEALRVAVHRLRQRYRQMLRATIAQTVATPAEVDDELRYLFQALAR